MKLPKFKLTWFEKQPTNPTYTLTIRLWANEHTTIFLIQTDYFLFFFLMSRIWLVNLLPVYAIWIEIVNSK